MKRYTGWGLKGLMHRSLCPHEVEVHHPPNMWVCLPTQKLSKHCNLEIIMEFSSCRHDWLHFQPQRCGVWLKVWLKFQASNHGLIFLVTTPILKLSRGPPVTGPLISIQKDTHSQESKVLGSSGIRNLNQRPNIRTKDAPSTPIIQEITKILGAL